MVGAGNDAGSAGPRCQAARGCVLTLVTIAESEVRLASLVDLTVVQGEPRTIEVALPNGYEVLRDRLIH